MANLICSRESLNIKVCQDKVSCWQLEWQYLYPSLRYLLLPTLRTAICSNSKFSIFAVTPTCVLSIKLIPQSFNLSGGQQILSIHSLPYDLQKVEILCFIFKESKPV